MQALMDMVTTGKPRRRFKETPELFRRNIIKGELERTATVGARRTTKITMKSMPILVHHTRAVTVTTSRSVSCRPRRATEMQYLKRSWIDHVTFTYLTSPDHAHPIIPTECWV